MIVASIFIVGLLLCCVLAGATILEFRRLNRASTRAAVEDKELA